MDNSWAAPYKAVKALMLSWKDSAQPEFQQQLKRLATEFKKYNFEVEKYKIESEKSHTRLSDRLNKFLLHDQVGTLLILYYGGHGVNNQDKENIWLRDAPGPDSKDYSKKPHVTWSSLQSLFLNECRSHVLFLLDCCYAASCARYTDASSTVEAISASGGLAPLLGKDSFTMFLAATLKECQAEQMPISAGRLCTKIQSRMFHTEWLEKYEQSQRATPSHHYFSDQNPPIIIGTVPKPAEDTEGSVQNQNSLQLLSHLGSSEDLSPLASLSISNTTTNKETARNTAALEAPNYVIPKGTENIPVQPVDKGTKVGRFTRGKRRTFASQSGTVWDIIFSPDGKLLASAHDDTIKLWDSQTGKICRQLEIKRRFWTRYRPFNRTSQLIEKRVAFSPDGRLLASACRDGLVDVWETTTGALHRIIDDQGSPVLDLAFSPNGTHIATVSLDKGVRLWDVSTGVLCDWRQGYDGWALRLIFSPEGESILCFYSDCSWETWNFGTSRTFCDRLIETDSSVNAGAALSGDYRMVAFALPHDAIILWDVSTPQVRRKLSGHSNTVVAVAFSPNNKVLASASQDKTVRLWDCATGELLDTFTNHIGVVRTVAFSPDGRYLASGSDDQMIMVWDLPRDPFEKDLEENDLSSRPKALNQFMHHDQ